MENLDFGWSFAVIILLMYGVIYCFIATINYILAVLLGGQIKKITDKTIIGKKENIFSTALPFLIASTIIYLVVIQLSFTFIYPKSIHTAIGGPLFWNPYFFYLTGGGIGSIVGLTCLALTRYSFTEKWKTIGRLKNGRTIFNFFLWIILSTIIIVIHNSIFKAFMPDMSIVSSLISLIRLPSEFANERSFYLIRIIISFVAILSYIIFIVFTTFLFLKWRCVNKTTKEKNEE